LRLRRAQSPLNTGSFTLIRASEDVLIYERRMLNDQIIVALNLSDEERKIALPKCNVLLSTLAEVPEPGMLHANEGMIVKPTS
jgi:glycosidase